MWLSVSVYQVTAADSTEVSTSVCVGSLGILNREEIWPELAQEDLLGIPFVRGQ